MSEATPRLQPSTAIDWPEPPHLRVASSDGAPEPCEIQFNDGVVAQGELLRFTNRDEQLVFRPAVGHPRHASRIVVRHGSFKRLRLKTAMEVRALEALLGGADVPASQSQVHVYNVEFADQEIESGETSGYVRSALGLFLYFAQAGDRVERVFIPESAIAYFQAGDPIGRVLVEENAVSEEQLKAAVEKQQEMRKLVLGDYLIEEGLITPQQLEQALAHQKTKPSLRLGEALIELGAVQPEALQIALARQRANRGRPLGQILMDMGVLDADTLNKIHAKKMGRPFVSLANFTATDDAIRAVSADAARRLGILPLSVEHGDLIVAAESQLDSAAINELTLSSRMRVVQVLAPGQEIRMRRDQAYGAVASESSAYDSSIMRFEGIETIEAAAASDEGFASTEGAHFHDRVDGATDPYLLEAIDRAIRAVEGGGSVDIQIVSKAGERTTRIRYERS